MSAEFFIEQWEKACETKIIDMPKLVRRAMHTIVGILLKDTTMNFNAQKIDMRDSSTIFQTSGSGKKLIMEIVEDMATRLKIKWARRSSITSAGAVGTIRLDKDKKAVSIYGDLKNYDLITCSEADSILFTKIDQHGNDLLTNLCESQDHGGIISKRLAIGSLDQYTSTTSLFFTTTVPFMFQKRWLKKGYIQRVSCEINIVPFPVYVKIRNNIFRNAGIKSSNGEPFRELAKILLEKKVPKSFTSTPAINEKFLKYAQKLDEVLIKLKQTEVMEILKSFTIRRDQKMMVYACHHAFLDERDTLEQADLKYAFDLALDSWRQKIDFIGVKRSLVKTCKDSILGFVEEGEEWTVQQIIAKIPHFTKTNIRSQLSRLVKEGVMITMKRGSYKMR